MQYNTYYLLSADFVENGAVTGQIDSVAFKDISTVEHYLGFKLPLVCSLEIEINNFNGGDLFSVDEVYLWCVTHTLDNGCKVTFSVKPVLVTSNRLDVPAEEPQFDEYELRVIRNSLLAYHHVLAENHDESSYIYKTISGVEDLQEKLSTMIEEV